MSFFLYLTLREIKKYRRGVCSVTTSRILWVGQSNLSKERIGVSLPLQYLRDPECSSVFSFGPQSICIQLNPIELVDPASNEIIIHFPPLPGYIRLTFKEPGRDDFFEQLKSALGRKHWLEPQKSERKAETFSTKTAGISGIQKQRAEEKKDNNEKLDTAFKDLDALMKSAHELVVLTERFSKTQDADDEVFKSVLANMGIPNPVTKMTSGTGYHEMLARQLTDFIFPLVQQNGGMMLLTDVFCRYNRARGTEMVSPDDLLIACGKCSDLGLRLCLRKFESGVLVIRDSLLDDDGISKRVLEFVESHGPLTALEFSEIAKISIALASEQLIVAENRGMLCRDETLNALKFYKNIFLI